MIGALLSSCSVKRYHNKTPIIGVPPPSKCTTEWFFEVTKDDTGYDVSIPKCVKKDVVGWNNAASISKELKQERGEISKWEIDKMLLAGIAAITTGVGALFGWVGGLLPF